jgi:twitching motility protein PilI
MAGGRYANFVQRAFHGEEHDWGVFALSRLARTPEFRHAAL